VVTLRAPGGMPRAGRMDQSASLGHHAEVLSDRIFP
jgi:hypothetical protein